MVFPTTLEGRKTPQGLSLPKVNYTREIKTGHFVAVELPRCVKTGLHHDFLPSPVPFEEESQGTDQGLIRPFSFLCYWPEVHQKWRRIHKNDSSPKQ